MFFALFLVCITLVYHLQYLTFRLNFFNIDLFADYKTKLLITSIFPDLRVIISEISTPRNIFSKAEISCYIVISLHAYRKIKI